ncbi:MAG: ABC transporter ATP-binding protein [Microbacteriaceae bacterium]|nr:ABC transporter ATP-binding protein [Microbacteriaceae bacterium]
MLTLTDVTLEYQDGDSTLTAVDRAGLEVPAGCFAAITGPSGSGKSSLLAIASTLVTPTGGAVELDGAALHGLDRKSAAKLRRERLGIVFQAPNLIPSLRAREQLEVMARLGAPELARLDRAALRERIDAVLDEVGMLDRAEFRPSQLSGGQRQRINIARAIVHSPAALLVDEPTSALDAARSREIIALLRDLTREHSLATVVVTHDVEHLPEFDRVHEMRDGVLTRVR